MSRVASLDMRCVLEFDEICDNCGECEDMPTRCCMDSMKECNSCLDC